MRYRWLLWLLIFWLGFAPIANAAMCRDRYGQQVCILKLERSAKNYWEYRAKVSIDGKKQIEQEIYNCRNREVYPSGNRTLTRKGKYPIPFKPNSPGELVCSLFQKS
ncbi:MAG: hypothetical protein ACFCU7_12425 [Pleurocapsa sp.]